MNVKEEIFNDDNIETLFNIYKNSSFRHPYLNPYNLYQRKLNLGFKLKVLTFNDQGYMAYISQKFLVNTFLLPGIINSSELYKYAYSFLKRKFIDNIHSFNTIHFYIDSQELLSLYIKEFNFLDQDLFIDVIYDNNVKWNSQIRHRAHIKIKKAIQSGVKIRFLKPSETDLLREWYEKCYTYAYDNKPPFAYSQIQEYTKYLLEHDLEKFIIAELDHKILGGTAILMDKYSNIAWYNLGAICKEGREKGVGDLLMNEAINIVKENGKIFELYGKSVYDLDKKHIGIFEFKKNFGREIEIPYFSYKNFIIRFMEFATSLRRRINNDG